MFSDERKKLQKLVLQNGGQFSTCLTKKCSHLVANISFGAFSMCILFACSKRTNNCKEEYKIEYSELLLIAVFYLKSIAICISVTNLKMIRKFSLTCYYKPGGDKYIVAQRWGNIPIVNVKWVEQCVARRGNKNPLPGITLLLLLVYFSSISFKSSRLN